MTPSKRGTPDFLLLALTFLIVGFGIVMVFSASAPRAALDFNDSLYFTKRQVVWAALGTFGMFVLMNLRYEKFKQWFIPFFVVVIFMLIAVLFREPVNGARSWFGIGTVGVQPSEFAKLATMMYLAALISKKGDTFRDFHKGLLPTLVIVGFVASLIMLQPDIGSTLVFLICSFTVIIAGGANLKHLFFSFSLIGVFAVLFINIYLFATEKFGYVYYRFATFVDPWSDHLGSGYHIIQSLYAFGHGGITGAGFGKSIQKLHYLPEAHNDFIFAIIGEELGFIGSALYLLTFVALLWRGLIVSLRCKDIFGTLIGTGIVTMLAVQALINIGGVTNSIPLTGVTLPFISYGGSSLLVCMFSMGILLSISRENNRSEG